MINLRVISSLNNLEVGHAVLQTYYARKHFHDSFSIALVQRGMGQFDAKGNSIKVQPGGVSIIPPYVPHTGRSHPEKGLNYKLLYPSVKILETLRHDFQPDQLILKGFKVYNSKLAQTFSPLHDQLMQSKDPLLQFELLEQLIGLLSKFSTSNTLFAKPVTSQRLEVSIELMHDEYYRKITLNELAAISHLSPSQYLRIFKKQMGLTPFSYLTSIRLIIAKQLMHKNISLSQVAQATGFYDQSHFSKYFKLIYGCNPKTYHQAKMAS